MKDYEYTVKFKTGIEIVLRASSEQYAIILAQADQINKGNAIFIVSAIKTGE